MADYRTRVLGGAKVLLLLAVVSPFLIYAVPQAVGAEASFVVLSGSMEPTLSPGDAIIVEEVPSPKIERGDIITYRDGESPTTHRVVDVRRTGDGLAFTTKGDANEDADPAPVNQEEVIGRVMQVDVPLYGEMLVVLPYLGYVVQFTDTPVGFALLVVGPFALLVVTELWSVVRATSGPAAASATGTDPSSSSGEAAGTPMDAQETTTAETSPDGQPTYTITPKDVRLTAGVLVLVVPYTGWVAYLEREAWAIAAAVAATLALLFGAAIVLLGGGGADTTDGADADARSEPTTDGGATVPADADPGGVDHEDTRGGDAKTIELDAEAVEAVARDGEAAVDGQGHENGGEPG